MLKILLDNDIAQLGQRNNIGKLPFEMPHNDIVNAESIKEVIMEYSQRCPQQVEDFIVTEKEADYIFIANKEREQVLIDQLEQINENYMKKHYTKPEPNSEETSQEVEEREFGLLKFNEERKFLDYKQYSHSADPEKTSLILVFFSDRILNLKAEEMKMMVHVQNKFQTLPFILEA